MQLRMRIILFSRSRVAAEMKQRSLKLSLKCLSTKKELVQCTELVQGVDVYSYAAACPPGIENLANNCYANAVLQCLMHHPDFLEFTKCVKTSQSIQPGTYNYVVFEKLV